MAATSRARVNRVSIFLPRDNDFYRGLLRQMQRGFEASGVECCGQTNLLGPDELDHWCRTRQPDLVLEMNRPRIDADGLPHDVLHACWIVDLHARPISEFRDSELTYLFCNAWAGFYPNGGFFRWLGPGWCPIDYPQRRDEPFEYDLSFAGHIPNPWTRGELDRDVTGGAGCTTFGDLLPLVEQALRRHRRSGRRSHRPPTAFLSEVDAYCRSLCGRDLVADDVLRYDLLARVGRTLNRTDLLDAVVRSSTSLAIYGPENWTRWPQYAPFYRGWLSHPAQLHRSALESRANLHEGVGIHFRSMNVMGSGGLLAYRGRASEQEPGGLQHEFSPHVHYVPIEIDTLSSDLEPYLSDPARAQTIREEASREIAARHQWKHRAQGILRDAAQF
ncbi:MAG: glycosyltransferase [Myxococcales bacterium FL481]|nr:MAG: glycosyltransferase [Myxococcales bacterium FL481]